MGWNADDSWGGGADTSGGGDWNSGGDTGGAGGDWGTGDTSGMYLITLQALIDSRCCASPSQAQMPD